MRRLNILTLALTIALLAAPAMAGEKYLYGSPTLSASISGTNELNPGDDITLNVIVKNSGLNTFKIVQQGIITAEDQPNTAKLLSATLTAGEAPITIKSDPQFMGDISGGASSVAQFNIKVADGAAPGVYELPLQVDYTYLQAAEQYGSDSMQYFYRTKAETLSLAVKVRADLQIEIVEMRTEDLNVGTEGYLYLTLKNSGHETGKNTIAQIVRNGNSPMIPTDGSEYIGDFLPGDIATVRFKVAVSRDAEMQSYPLDVMATCLNSEGATTTSRTVTIGVPAAGKTDFEVVQSTITASPGQKTTIEVQYRNNGATTVYNAQVRLSAVDPFTSNDDTAYLGDMKPGETATARFVVNVDNGATIKAYGLDSEIRYRDALKNSQISDTMKVQVTLVEQEGLMNIFANPLVLSVIGVVILGGGYYIMVQRKKK
jgi:hypothetical protein